MPDHVTSPISETAWHRVPLTEQIAQIQNGQASLADVLEHYLQRQHDINPIIHAFSVLEHDRAREDAARLIAERDGAKRDGTALERTKYFGAITADKDLDSRKGSPNFRGSAATSGKPEDQDTPVTQALNQAQVISTGRTQVPEFGLTGHSLNGRFTPAENPWKIGINPGGSSSGAAAAVAAGLIPAAVASDAGGSVRIPAASCGVVGYKPSRQYLPYDGKNAGNRNSVHGSIARNVADAALLADALNPDVSGHLLPGLQASSALDAVPNAASGGRETPATQKPHKPLESRKPLSVLATHYTPWSETLTIDLPAIFRTGFDHAVNALGELGHEVAVCEELTGFSGYPASFIRLWQKSAAMISLTEEEEARLLPFTAWLREEGETLSDALIAGDLEVMQHFEAWFDDQTAGYDAILTPALGLIGQTHEWHNDPDPVRHFEKQCEYSPYSSYINMVGNCAITLPVMSGTEDTHHIPISVQLIGKKGADRDLMLLAHQVERHLSVPIAYPYDS